MHFNFVKHRDNIPLNLFCLAMIINLRFAGGIILRNSFETFERLWLGNTYILLLGMHVLMA